MKILPVFQAVNFVNLVIIVRFPRLWQAENQVLAVGLIISELDCA